jgi:anaerobic magnesium-protoporphyrin IX monomethyl ester cyclase
MEKGEDLLLINAGGSKKRVYQDLSNDYSAIEPPFWAALTAGFVRKKGFSAGLIDANAENLTYDETAKKIEEHNPRLVNVVVYGQHPSASTQLMTSVGELCRKIKEQNPQRKIILTGLHPSALPYRTIKEEDVDYVCEGEGFHTLTGLLQGKSVNQIPGLWWKEKGIINQTIRAENISDLTTELGEVAWDLIPNLGMYKAHNWQCLDNLKERGNYASLSTSLGCPHQCEFCSISATFGEHKTRFWSPEWVLNQIDILVNKKGMKNLKIIDEEFTLRKSHFMPIVEGLIKRNYGLNIWAYTRISNIPDADSLAKLKSAGINWLCPGIESGDATVRQKNAKNGYDDLDIIEGIKRIQNAGINVLGNYVFGITGETKESMEKTFSLSKELNCEFANFYCAIAWPGSVLYKQSIEKGVKMPPRWQDYAQHSYEFLPLPTDSLSPKGILEFRDESFHNYFTSPKYLNMVEDKFGKEARRHIEEMTKIKLKRRILEQ